MDKEKFYAQYNPANERVKYNYRRHLSAIGKKDEKTILSALQKIRDFEIFIKFESFCIFNDQIAGDYIKWLLNQDEALSLSYINDAIRNLKDFLNWLERQRGYRSKLNYNQIEYLSLTNNQRKTAKAIRYQKAYTFETILDVIRSMPAQSVKNKRDKAIVSMQALCTLRISELRTAKIGNLIKEDGRYFIDATPKDMHTKFAKSRQVVFIPLGEDIIDNVINWYGFLKSIGFKDHEPLFPVIDNKFNMQNLLEQNLTHEGIKSDGTIRNIFKKAFEAAEEGYINPHSFRKTLARFAQHQNPAFLNAVRQNLGHSSINTTLNSYGQLSHYDQRKIIGEMKGVFE